MSKSMMEQLLEMTMRMKDATDTHEKIVELPNFKAMIMIKAHLMANGISIGDSNLIVSSIKIDVSADFFRHHEEADGILTNFAATLANVTKSYRKVFGDIGLGFVKNMSLTYDG